MKFDMKKMIKQMASVITLTNFFSFAQAQSISIEKNSNQSLEICVSVGEETIAIPKCLVEDFKKHPKEFLELSKAVGKGEGNYLFWLLPDNFMDTYACDLISLAKQIGPSTWKAYSFISRIAQDTLKKKKSLTEAFELAAKLNTKFGITHFNRYYNSNLMQNNLDNLSLMYNSEKPVALVFQNKNDPNNAFSRDGWIKDLEKIEKGYKIFIYEVENENSTFNYIKKISQDYGKISLLIFGGHGTPCSLNLGKIECGEENSIKEKIKYSEQSFLDTTDKKDFEKIEGYIENNAKIILASCSTGKGKKENKNLANLIAQSLPGRTIYSPTKNAKTPDLIFNDFICKYSLKEVGYEDSFGTKVETYMAKCEK